MKPAEMPQRSDVLGALLVLLIFLVSVGLLATYLHHPPLSNLRVSYMGIDPMLFRTIGLG